MNVSKQVAPNIAIESQKEVYTMIDITIGYPMEAILSNTFIIANAVDLTDVANTSGVQR